MILLTGANGVVGKPLLDALGQANRPVACVTRKAKSGQVQWDLSAPPSKQALSLIAGSDTLVHCAPIWLLTPHLDVLHKAGVKRLVVFSSTSVISKQASADPQEQTLVSQLKSSEAQIQAFAEQRSLDCTILRPSMIYGYGRDHNVSHIARFIARRGFMLLVGQAHGLRQPVHADDLVAAVLKVLESPQTANKVYNLAGAERLSYRAMVERIFAGLNKRQRIFTLPLWCFRIALKAAVFIRKFDYTPEMANRMAQDLIYSNQMAIDDFGYSPQAFLQHPERDLP